MSVLLAPPLAFPIFIVLALLLSRFGKRLAGPQKSDTMKSSVYSGGEVGPEDSQSPGYRTFLVVPFFFAFLHFGMLILGTGGSSKVESVYLFGLLLALLVFILG
ncbi:MAG: hypothetical protein ACYC6L_15585 [Anaerolineae bacterium]